MKKYRATVMADRYPLTVTVAASSWPVAANRAARAWSQSRVGKGSRAESLTIKLIKEP